MGASGERNSKLHIAKNVTKSKCVIETAARKKTYDAGGLDEIANTRSGYISR